MVAARPFLRDARNRPLFPHRQLEPLRNLLVVQAELYRAAAEQLGDPRYREAADVLDEAAAVLRRAL